MAQEEVFFSKFQNIKPGWIFDLISRNMISMDAAPSEKSMVKLVCKPWKNNFLLNLASNPKIVHEYVWKRNFLESKEKSCFVINVDASYSETLSCINSPVKGTVTKVNYKRTIIILVCSDDENSSDAFISYINNAIAGVDVELDERTCASCKKCFIYDGNESGKNKNCSYDSVVHCFKEVSRIIDAMKNWENFYIWSWFVLKDETISANEAVSEHFYKAKLFDTSATDTYFQCSGNSPAQHNFGDDVNKPKISGENAKEEPTVNNKTDVYTSTITVTFHSEIKQTDSPEFTVPITSIHKTIKPLKSSALEKSVKDNFNDTTHEKVTANKVNDFSTYSLPKKSSRTSIVSTERNLLTSVTSVIDGIAKESVDGKSGQNEDLHNTVRSHSSIENVDKKIATSGRPIEKTVSTIDNLPHADFATKTHHSDSINCPIKKTDCVTTCISSPFPAVEIIESADKYDKSNGIAKDKESIALKYKDIKENDEKQRNSKKRPSVAGGISLNGPSKLESHSNDQHQVKKLKKENFIDYLGKKIAKTVVEENGIWKIEVGKKTFSEKKGKVIVLLGATGSGKTSIVNLCANFYFGSLNADDEKLFIVDPKTKTDRVTVYTFYPEGEDQPPLTVVDTPGLNDSTGAEIHDHVDALKSFLALACSQGLEINTLAFVAQAHLVRLTSSEKLVMDYVRSLFGSEVEKHIMALVTFSDNQPIPPVIEAMEQYGFKSPLFVKFNNTLLISKAEAVDDLDRIYWRTGIRSWKKCLKQLNVIDSLSHVAISSINKEVFNMSVLNKYTSSLEAELRNFITIYRKKNEINELFSDKQLQFARKKVWKASNDAYNVNMFTETKEIFLINSCQLQLENEPIRELSAVIKLFLLLDNESTLRCVLEKLVAVLVHCLKVFDKHPKAQETFLATFCYGCHKLCFYKKISDCRSDYRVVNLKCNCDHSSGVHGTPPDDFDSPSLPIIRQCKLFSLTANSLQKEISKYDDMNCGVRSLWTVGQVVKCLQLDDPEKYCKKRINEILTQLSHFS